MVDDLTKFDSYFQKAVIPLRIACTTKSGWPMAVSLWYQFKNGNIMCATQKSSRIVAYLQSNNRCAFEIAADQPPYCGVRGQALASIDDQIGGEVLEQLLHRYVGGTESDFAKKLLAKRENEVAIIFKPINYFTWDFSERMGSISQKMLDMTTKFCP